MVRRISTVEPCRYTNEPFELLRGKQSISRYVAHFVRSIPSVHPRVGYRGTPNAAICPTPKRKSLSEIDAQSLRTRGPNAPAFRHLRPHRLRSQSLRRGGPAFRTAIRSCAEVVTANRAMTHERHRSSTPDDPDKRDCGETRNQGEIRKPNSPNLDRPLGPELSWSLINSGRIDQDGKLTDNCSIGTGSHTKARGAWWREEYVQYRRVIPAGDEPAPIPKLPLGFNSKLSQYQLVRIHARPEQKSSATDNAAIPLKSRFLERFTGGHCTATQPNSDVGVWNSVRIATHAGSERADAIGGTPVLI